MKEVVQQTGKILFDAAVQYFKLVDTFVSQLCFVAGLTFP